MTQHDLLHVLTALHDLARDGRRAHLAVLVHRTSLPMVRVADALVHLEARGLADARRARLTLRGLAVATGLTAQGRLQQHAHAA